MSESSLVECPVCEVAFDPTAAGGWCTNSECGEWRHEGADRPTGADETESSHADGSDDAVAETETTGSGDAEAEAGEASADPTPAIRKIPDMDTEDSPQEADDAEESTPVEEESEETPTVTCPSCGESVEEDVSFCPSCGEDLASVEPGEDDDELTACPACETDVGPDASFCPSCGENLDAHRESAAMTVCPSCGDDVSADDSFCVSCGEDLDAHRESGSGTSDSEAAEEESSEPVPESLVLQTRGEELTVEDGDTVGRELRRIVTESDGDEDDAVRIHREHVRFVREDDGFHLVDLGRNPTRLNDDRLEEGDREPVAPGDELRLSDVITLAVREP